MHYEDKLHLPDAVRTLAFRLGAQADADRSCVRLTQHGSLREGPTDRWRHFRAHQCIALQRPAFEWNATTGPLGSISVIDALVDGRPRLEVKLFRCIRLARLAGGIGAAKGELMRYLAELAWAPDAILANRKLDWTVPDAKTMRVNATLGQVCAQIDFSLNSEGRIDTVMARDRPRWENGGFVERPWHGHFSDYRLEQKRWLPFRGEVGWTVDGVAFTAWKGNIDTWAVA